MSAQGSGHFNKYKLLWDQSRLHEISEQKVSAVDITGFVSTPRGAEGLYSITSHPSAEKTTNRPPLYSFI